nr:MAG TPA: hypothetical protein [Caudoviricetes sp.]DAO51457.1 MAG TPA: hypothetical protein [Caudoviricetes sp.]
MDARNRRKQGSDCGWKILIIFVKPLRPLFYKIFSNHGLNCIFKAFRWAKINIFGK